MNKAFSVVRESESPIYNPSEYIEKMAPKILETYAIPIFGTKFESPSFITCEDGYFEREARSRKKELVEDYPARISYIKMDESHIHYPYTSQVMVRIPFEGADWKNTESELLETIFKTQIQAGFLQTRGFYADTYFDEELTIPEEDMVHSLLDAVCIEATEKLSGVDYVQRSLSFDPMPLTNDAPARKGLPNLDRILAETIMKRWMNKKDVHALRYAIKSNWNKQLHAFSHCSGFNIGEYVTPTFRGSAKEVKIRQLRYEGSR